MKFRAVLVATAGFAILNGLPNAASALTALTADGTTNIRSGPGTHYRVLGRVRGGSHVEVRGCLRDRSWCRTTASGVSGWIFGARLQFIYDQRPGEALDVPIVGFAGSGQDRERWGAETTGRVLGRVTDRPGYCYVLDAAGNSVVESCPGNPDGEPEPRPRPGDVLGEVTDRPGYCYALDDAGNSTIVPCPAGYNR